MRLIDADAFKEKIGTETKMRRIRCMSFDEQPTAYDLDKVVEQLEGRTKDGWFPQNVSSEAKEIYKCAMIHAIEIVKGGVVNG